MKITVYYAITYVDTNINATNYQVIFPNIDKLHQIHRERAGFLICGPPAGYITTAGALHAPAVAVYM